MLFVKLLIDFFFTLLAEKPKIAEKKYFIDTNNIHLPKANMEILNPVKDGMSEYGDHRGGFTFYISDQ